MRILHFWMILGVTFLFARGNPLLFYCGATMVRPMKQIAERYTRRYGGEVVIVQGGSGDLLRRLKALKKGDLYLPGSSEYLEKINEKDLFGYRAVIGENSLVLLVRKGNPLKIHGLEDLLRPELRVAIGAARLGSIGRVTREALLREKGKEFFCRIQNRAMYFVTDSRELVRMLKKGQIDVGISWKATAFFPENRSYVEAILLPRNLSEPKKLAIAVLKYSQNPEAAKRFVDLVASPEGQTIMKNNGFR